VETSFIGNERMRIAITSTNFDTKSNKCVLDVLEELGHSYQRLSSDLSLYDPHIVLAGTELYSREILSKLKSLVMIARDGVGYDSIDLQVCKNRDIIITNAPVACMNAVAELVIAQMINLRRHLITMHNNMHVGIWKKLKGSEVSNSTIGIIGCGHIGSQVLQFCLGLGVSSILVNDINPEIMASLPMGVTGVNKDCIFANSDIITLHVPLTKLTRGMVSTKYLDTTRSGVSIINTSRGSVVNEQDLIGWLKDTNNNAALDVFVEEPYCGKLLELSNVITTPHIGSYSIEGRLCMEDIALAEIIRFVRKEQVWHEVLQ